MKFKNVYDIFWSKINRNLRIDRKAVNDTFTSLTESTF